MNTILRPQGSGGRVSPADGALDTRPAVQPQTRWLASPSSEAGLREFRSEWRVLSSASLFPFNHSV